MTTAARNVLVALMGGFLILNFFGCNNHKKDQTFTTTPAVPSAGESVTRGTDLSQTESDSAAADPATLIFHSFDGGGPSFTMEIEDASVLSYRGDKVYNSPKHDQMTGAGFKVIFTLIGLKPGDTAFTVTAESPITGIETYRYFAHIDADLNVTVEPENPDKPIPLLGNN